MHSTVLCAEVSAVTRRGQALRQGGHRGASCLSCQLAANSSQPSLQAPTGLEPTAADPAGWHKLDQLVQLAPSNHYGHEGVPIRPYPSLRRKAGHKALLAAGANGVLRPSSRAQRVPASLPSRVVTLLGPWVHEWVSVMFMFSRRTSPHLG